MRLIIEIKMDNAAFTDESARDGDQDDAGARGMEAARILRELAIDLQNGIDADDSYSLRDANGNKVGKCEVVE